ncbi:MAG: DUF6364 family protein [Desulfobacterales bacterium]
MNTDSLTIQLPVNEIEFLRQYAEKHRITISELIDRYVKYLKKYQGIEIHPDIAKITGIVPENIDAREMFHQYSMEKHS